MQSGFLQTDVENRGIVFDPRTKMLLLITMAVFVLGRGRGRYSESIYAIVLCGSLYPVSVGKKVENGVPLCGVV